MENSLDIWKKIRFIIEGTPFTLITIFVQMKDLLI